MTARQVAGALVVAAGVLAGCGLAGGAVSAFAASPVALALSWLARHVLRAPGSEAPRRVVGAGLGGVLLAGVLACGGSWLASLLALAAAIGVVAAGARLSLALEPPLEDPGSGEAPAVGWAAVALDESLQLAWELRGLLGSRAEAARVADEVRLAADRNHREGWLAHPEEAYLAPPPLEKPGLAPRPVRAAPHLEELRFASEYQPLDPEIRADYLAVARNREAVVHLCRHPGGPRPMLLLVHGYGLGHPSLTLRAWDGAWLHGQLGLDLAFFGLPLHGARACAGLPGSGWLGLHPLWTGAALGQAVWELRRVSGWLRASGAPALGVAGLGLGGTVAALFAAVEENLACAVALRPVASLESLAWRRLPPHVRAEGRAHGLSEQLLGEAWARHAPLRVRPRAPHAARLVVGARADRLVPHAQVTALWDHWGRPALHWQPGTHLLPGDRAGLRERLRAHLCETLIAAASG